MLERTAVKVPVLEKADCNTEGTQEGLVVSVVLKKKNQSGTFETVTLDPAPTLKMGELIKDFVKLEVGEYEATYTWEGVSD